MVLFVKYYLPLFFILFIVIVFVIPTARVYRQTGINPFRFITNHDKAHDFVGASMKLFIILILITIIIFSFIDSEYYLLAPFYYMEVRSLKIIGLILGHIAIAGIVFGQRQMRLSWRIGIDYENKTLLVMTGLFRFSRNPIYLFLLIALLGLFLIIPNAITFAVLFSAFLILHVTIRMEEQFLEAQHGDVYREYKNTVRRLL